MTDERDEDLDALIKTEIDDLRVASKTLVAKARNLVELLDDAEVNHGGLYSGKTMRAIGELRLELQRWSK